MTPHQIKTDLLKEVRRVRKLHKAHMRFRSELARNLAGRMTSVLVRAQTALAEDDRTLQKQLLNELKSFK